MKNNRLIYLILIIMGIWLLILSLSLPTSEKNDQPININEINVSGFSTDFTKVVDENKDRIVTISADNNIATGFVYSQNDNRVYIVTAYHSIAGSNNINVSFGVAYNLSAKVLGFDEYCDIALLVVESPYTINHLKLGDATLLKRGEFVINIGTPINIDYAGNVSMAMVSSPLLTIDNSITIEDNTTNYYLDVIALSSNLKSGYSGSPVLNMNGELVGMITMNFDDNFDMAITVNEIKIIVDKLLSENEYHKSLFGIKGIYIKDMPNYEKTNLNLDIEIINGIYVSKVRENSICFNAGIRPGDIITRINDIEIHNINDYLLASYGEYTEFDFEVIRNNETIHLGITND